MYKILLFGSMGMLGTYINKFFSYNSQYDVHCIDRKKFEINKNVCREQIIAFLKQYNPDQNTYIINCIGLIPQRNSTNHKDYYIINSLFPIFLSQAAEQYTCKFIHFTTDCVFDGKTGNYDEDSEISPVDDYGMSKFVGDAGIKYGTILRTSIIGFEEQNKKSFLEWVISSNGKKISGYSNHIWNGITCLEYCKILHHLIANNYIDTDCNIRHIYSPDKVSKYELINIIKEIFNLDIEVEKVEINPCDRSLSSISSIQNYTVLPIKQQIIELLTFDIFNPIQDTENFITTKPFPYIKQDNFLNPYFATAVQNEILNIESTQWDRYENPFETKFTLRDKFNMPKYLQILFRELTNTTFINKLSQLCGKKLFIDETRNFWGVHLYKEGDKLDIHVDAGIHPTMNLKKQLTLGLYLSKDWNQNSGGELEIWEGENSSKNDAKLIRKITSIYPNFNTLVLFINDDYSWHGNPNPTKGENFKRIFVTVSYLSEDMNYENMRKKAFFIKTPDEPENIEKDKLRLLRADPEKYKEIYRISSR